MSTMPRRQKKNRDLPDNLYPNGKYFKYIHPVTKRAISVPRPRAEAIRLAQETNRELLQRTEYGLLGHPGDFDALLDGFIHDYLPTREYRPSTLAEIHYKLNGYRGKFPPIQYITVKSLKDALSQHPNHAYIKHRNLWIDIFRYAISEGLVQFNCAEATLRKRPPPRARERLTESAYEAIYAQADPWFRNVMTLARITLQRPGDLVRLKYADIRDGYLYIQQSKSAGLPTANLKIRIWPELHKTIQATRTPPLSPYVLHRHSKRRTSDRQRINNSVTREFLSKTFARYRTAAGIEAAPGREPPTFYELVSLGARWYEANGYPKSFIQALKGHTDEKTTDIYLDDEQTKWTEIAL